MLRTFQFNKLFFLLLILFGSQFAFGKPITPKITSESSLGTESNPIKISLVPGQDVRLLEDQGRRLEKWFLKDAGLYTKVVVPINFITVVESLGSKRADMAFMNTFGYVLAHEKYQARVRLTGITYGRSYYHGQIIAHVDGPKSIEELNGKKIAFVDPASTSGHILALKLFKEKKIKPKEVIFAGRHDSVALMVYQKRVDAGATYNVGEDHGIPQDARKLLLTQYPDVFEKVKILALTGPVPNDPVVFRKDFPIDTQEKFVASVKRFFKDPEGLKVMDQLYHMTDVKDATDADYVPVRKMLLDIGKSANELIK